MKKNKRGFSLFLTFLVSSVVFMLVGASQNIARLSMNTGRAAIIDCIAFQAADGGLEKGLAKIRQNFVPFTIKYDEKIIGSRMVSTTVTANNNKGLMTLRSEVSVYEAGNLLTKKVLLRNGIENNIGRNGIGLFMEEKWKLQIKGDYM